MDIEQALILLEKDYVEKDIKALSPRDRLNLWQSLTEFYKPKIQRSVFEPINQDDFKIKIEYANNKAETYQSVPLTLDQTTKD